MPPPPNDYDQVKSFAKRLADAIWPSCHEVTRLTSEGRDHPQSLAVRIRLAVHRFFCKWCARYARQLDLLHDASRKLPEHLEEAGANPLDQAAKARLKQKLREQVERDS